MNANQREKPFRKVIISRSMGGGWIRKVTKYFFHTGEVILRILSNLSCA